MKINITPYIDIEKANDTPGISSVSTSSTMTEADFDTQLCIAKKAITALSIDTVLSGDKEAALDAAAILSSSGRPELQSIGEVMSDYASSSDSMTKSEAATAILQAFGYAPSTSSAATEDTEETTSTTQESNTTQDASSTQNSNSTESSAASKTDSSASKTDSSASKTDSSVSANLVSSTSKNLTCSGELESYFLEAAKTYNVDINLLKAIAKTESDFDPSCTSSSGAMGVMQLMPFTAEELGVKNAYDAHDNIMGGAKLIASHIEKYNGDLSLSLAAYNAGSGAVARAGGVPASAKRYVEKVLGYYEES